MSTVIEQLRYVVLGTRDLEAAAHFAGAELGLQPLPAGNGEQAFRSDHRQYSLVYSNAAPRRHAVGLELRDDAALQATVQALQARGIAVQHDAALAARRNVRALAAFTTPGGLCLELVVRPQDQGWRFFAARDCGMAGLAALALRSTDVAADEALLVELFGLQVRDWIGDAAYLGLDAAHHRLALFPAATAGVLAVEFEVQGLDQVMQQYHRLRELPQAVVHGPGRRPASGQAFLTFAGPDAVYYSFVTDGERIDAAAPRRPRQFAMRADSHCAWGSDCGIAELLADAVPARPALRGVTSA
ncbi:hypothetical protein [Stenotrophomonas mori]|uniref:VOC domain-containing protein n=1 Tax=Stenotrophomonas mori TaxID=2871096 RepID=A0ABT0SKU4_9GAMM|nr:hypothetical protein [Stenotrophomonas mori]MCL7715746.1 hypothetical protein [Stenotrophomonas mori]